MTSHASQHTNVTALRQISETELKRIDIRIQQIAANLEIEQSLIKSAQARCDEIEQHSTEYRSLQSSISTYFAKEIALVEAREDLYLDRAYHVELLEELEESVCPSGVCVIA